MNIEIKKVFIEYWYSLIELLPHFISALIVFFIFVFIGKMLYRILGKRIKRQWKDSIVSGFFSQALKWIFYLIGILAALNILGFGGLASGLIAGAGVSAIIFGFAFKDIGENFLAGILLAFNSPFEIGNIIEVDGNKGTVKVLSLRTTHLRNIEGKDIFIPNSTIVKNSVINYTKDGFLRLDFMVGIAPECDIHTTRHLILNHIDQQKTILKTPKPNVLVKELGEFTVDLQVLFWVDVILANNLPDDYLGHSVRSKVIADVKEILDNNNISMPSQVLEHKMYGENKLVIKQ